MFLKACTGTVFLWGGECQSLGWKEDFICLRIPLHGWTLVMSVYYCFEEMFKVSTNRQNTDT